MIHVQNYIEHVFYSERALLVVPELQVVFHAHGDHRPPCSAYLQLNRPQNQHHPVAGLCNAEFVKGSTGEGKPKYVVSKVALSFQPCWIPLAAHAEVHCTFEECVSQGQGHVHCLQCAAAAYAGTSRLPFALCDLWDKRLHSFTGSLESQQQQVWWI